MSSFRSLLGLRIDARAAVCSPSASSPLNLLSDDLSIAPARLAAPDFLTNDPYNRRSRVASSIGSHLASCTNSVRGGTGDDTAGQFDRSSSTESSSTESFNREPRQERQ